MNYLQLWELRLKSSEDIIFEISEFVVLTIQKAGRMVSLLAESIEVALDME